MLENISTRRRRRSGRLNMVSGTNTLAWSVLIAAFLVLVHTVSATTTPNNSSVNHQSDLRNNTSTAAVGNVTKLHHVDESTKTEGENSKTPSISHKNETKQFLATGNELWDGLIRDCLKRPTFSCFQKNVHSYLDSTLELGDVNVTSRFAFTTNKVDYTKYTKEANERHHHDSDDADNEIPDEEARSESPLEEVTDAMYGKGIKFMMTHDIVLKMPEMMFDGATLKISPRSFEGNGALVKIELMPKIEDNQVTGRILFKKIKKFFKNKLLLSFFAIVLVIKLLAVKMFWLLPLLVGVATAKKLVLKFLLFLFPALAQIFKLCGYYHANYHQTKYHHHQHHINHHHTVVPPWLLEHHDDHHDHHHPTEVIYTSPPKGHPSEYLHSAPSPYHSSEWESSGPGLGSEYISDIHRNAHVNSFKPKLDDVNEINAWGLGTTVSPSSDSHSFNANPFVQQSTKRIKTSGASINPVYVPQGVAYQPKRTPAAPQYNAIIDQNMIREAQRLQAQQAQQQEALRIQAEQKLIAHQQKILHQQPFVEDPQNTAHIIDPFYGPILQRIDKIFQQLGFAEEPCRERLVCSIYKNPSRYSPHSNFISAELSRDSNELQKPTTTNPAVVRFYRYVQAARNGQDQRDCLRLYPQCGISTERKR